jgi:hypothetical protein
MLLVILKTQVSSASAQSVVAAIIPRKSLTSALERWRQAMNNMSQYDRMRQIALYLLCWGEAAQVRFVPECLCFIFKCADDYYRSPECQNRVDPVPEGLYLRAVIKPLYRFIRDQGYESVDGKFVRRERDHDRIIGYDDINQLFWYPEGIARIVLTDKVRHLRYLVLGFIHLSLHQTRLVDIPPAQRFMRFDRIDWNRAFFKTYYEKRSFGHLLVNFNRIWVIHVSLFWFYTSYNAPDHLPTKARTLVRVDMVCHGPGRRHSNVHHDTRNARRIFVHSRQHGIIRRTSPVAYSSFSSRLLSRLVPLFTSRS